MLIYMSPPLVFFVLRRVHVAVVRDFVLSVCKCEREAEIVWACV